jgi:hypothetical protein
MTGRLHAAFGGGPATAAADAAIGRGMADVLAALDNVIDDDAALARVCAGLGTGVPCPAPARAARTAAGQVGEHTGMPGPAVTTARAGWPVASRRRRILCSVAGAAALLTVGAVALAAIGVPGARHARVDTTAYVVQRVDSALSAAEPGAIAQLTVTTRSAPVPGGKTTTTTAEEWSYGDWWRSVTNSQSGHPAYAEGFSPAAGYTVVSYRTRTWARKHGRRVRAVPSLAPATGPRGCGQVVADLPLLFQPGLPASGSAASSLPATVARDLRTAISCGTLAAAGRERVDGIEAIKLTSRQDSPIAETIWVSPGTYLPVRIVVRSALGGSFLRQTANITWLPPTAQHLASLTVPIPAGFRRVPFATAAPASAQRVSG